MPSKERHIRQVLAEQEWIDRYEADDPCLFDELVSAYVTRGHAAREGASSKQLAHGDSAIEAIKTGRSSGRGAWASAKTAIRRFSEVYGALTLGRRRRRGRALSKRYGRTSPATRVR